MSMNRPKTLSGKRFLLAARGLLAGALAVAALGLAAAPAAAATATVAVNTTVDQATGGCPVDCSLRDAVAFAAPGDTILIPPGHFVLTLGHILIDKNLILHGGGQFSFGARLTTLDGNGSSRLFLVLGPSVEFSDLSLINGNAIPGGAVWVIQGTATFRRCTFAGNQTFAQGGALSLANSNLTVEDSTFSDNHAHFGGAIDDGGSQISIVNSTFSGNTADVGGGFALLDSTATLVNNTLTANQGAAIDSFNSTLSLSNNIVAGNLGADCTLSGGTLASDHNLDGDGSCGFNGPGDLSGVDPLLGPLANNGGGTDTHALAAGSPAIDAGNDAACPATDQRGLARPQGAACDIGAYELLAQPTPRELIGQVIAFIESLDLQNGIENALVSKLENTLDKLDRGNTGAAINELEAFINQVKAQRGKKIPADVADLLVEAAEAILDIIRG